MVLALVVVAYFPFSWNPPRTVRNQVTRSADGSLRFGDMNNARTPGTPTWVSAVRMSGTIQIRLEAFPQSSRENASIIMLASDFWHTDFAVGQDRSDLLVWLRRPGSNANGDPAFVLPGVLRPQQWDNVAVELQHGGLRIDVDGRTRLTAHLPVDFATVWGPGQIALGDEVHGGGPWQGQLRHAQVRSPDYTVDYVRPGALMIPQSYLYLPDHIEPFPPMDRGQWLNAFLDMLLFIPLGVLIMLARRPPMRPIPAALLAAALAVMLGAGKFLFDRHTAVIDVAMEVTGGLFGAFLAARLARARRYGRTIGGYSRSSRTTPTRPSA
jgi:hypothetical protein